MHMHAYMYMRTHVGLSYGNKLITHALTTLALGVIDLAPWSGASLTDFMYQSITTQKSFPPMGN